MHPPIEITIESLGGLGDGIASLAGKPVFVPKSCAGDVVNVRMVHETQETMRAEILSVVTAGPDRVAAPCPHFADCGGCTLQQLAPVSYREFKTRMFETALKQAGLSPAHMEITFLPAASRRRVEFKTTRANGKLSLAFYKMRSHALAPIDQCLVLDPKLQAITEKLPSVLEGLPFADDLQTISLTLVDSGIDMVLGFRHSRTGDQLGTLAEMPGIARISALLENGAIKPLVERTAITMTLGNYDVPLPADAFLQASREGQSMLTHFALTATEGATSLVDLFCGIGTYSFPLCNQASIHGVEGDAHMVAAMLAVIKKHDIKNVTALKRDLFKNPLSAKELGRFDAAIINPPRPGAKSQTEQLAKSGIAKIVMISCNPATFARDARLLKNSGFTCTHALGIDQFVWSPYLEIAAAFTR